MDGCYHDKQDFKSDFNIEVAREGDLLEAGQDLKDRKCDKNPGHQDFIPFKDLTLEHLPIENRSTEILDKIKQLGSVVVRLVVNEHKLGTGYVDKLDDKYRIRTNNHVVKTNDEVINCIVEFHYDYKDNPNVFVSKGVQLVDTCFYRDYALFTFSPIPDFLYQLEILDDDLPIFWIGYQNNQIDSRRVSVGNTSPKRCLTIGLDINSSVIKYMFIISSDKSISYLKSSYFKFQPITSNTQKLTSIEIHIDDEDGNRRVIPGNVVKFGHEFVVKMSKSIFQDEVKKCRLVWNGKVIGHGTRLYFDKFESSKFYCGIDLEQRIERGIENCGGLSVIPYQNI